MKKWNKKVRYFKSLLKELSDLIPLMKLLICSVVVMLLYSFPTYAADYYISPSGDDSSPGTLTSPWQSITKANGKVKAGDTVYLRSGSYDEMIAPGKSGEANACITYKNYPGEKPIIDRSRVLTGWHHLRGSIYWAEIPRWSFGVWEDDYKKSGYYCSYWTQQNLSDVNGPGKFFIDSDALRVYVWTKSGDNPNEHIMRTAAGHGAGFSSKSYIVVDGIHMQYVKYSFKLNDCSYCKFINMNIKYVAGYGIFLSGQSHHNKVLDNVIFHVGSWYWDEGDGIYLNGHHNLVDGNDISVTGHNPIGTRGDVVETYKNIIQNNKVYKSGSSGLNANVNTHHEVWRNNLSYENTGAGFQSDSSNNMIYGNIFYRNGLAISLYTTNGRAITGNKVLHNICFNNNHVSTPHDFDVEVGEWGGGTCDVNIFKNNIFYNTSKKYIMFFDGRDLKSNYFADNDFFDGSGALIRITPVGIKPLSSRQNQYPTNFSNNRQDDPSFMNVVGDDFKLTPDSKCIEHGGFLTKTEGSGTGTVITVKDAGYFCDGFGIVDGDLIQLKGSAKQLRILRVDYVKNQLEVDENISWQNGAGVSFIYTGLSPDIGAIENAGDTRIPAVLTPPHIHTLR